MYRYADYLRKSTVPDRLGQPRKEHLSNVLGEFLFTTVQKSVCANPPPEYASLALLQYKMVYGRL